MDWAKAIERNSEALNRIIAALFALLGLVGEATVGRIPQSLHRAVLAVLRPAESAVRRLIVVVARNVVVELAPSRPMPAGKVIGKRGGSSTLLFQLFDPRKRFKPVRAMKFKRLVPRIHVFGSDPRISALFPAPRPIVVPPPPPDGRVNSQRLARRLQALKSALDDLPRQARRLARWQQRRKASPDRKFLNPLRPGRPPGYRKKPIHEVDEVLAECDFLADEAMKPDTS